MINNVNIFNIWHRCRTCNEKKCIDSISLIYNWLILKVVMINNMYMRNLTISHTNICIIFDKIVQYVYINFFKLFSLMYKYICMFFFSSYRSCQVHGYYDCGGHVDEWRNTCRMLCTLLLSSGQLPTLTKNLQRFHLPDDLDTCLFVFKCISSCYYNLSYNLPDKEVEEVIDLTWT